MTQAAASANPPNRREKRRQAILDAALEVFLEQGYGATSLNDIVQVSGGSLSTLYELFGSKAGLFQAVIEKGCFEFFELLEAEDVDGKRPEEGLRIIAARFFEGLIQQNGASLLRLIVSEVPQFPEVGIAFYRAGPDTAREKVASYLTKQTRRGLLKVDDPSVAASTFISMVLRDFQMRILCGEEVNLTPEETGLHLGYVVRMFLRMYGTAGEKNNGPAAPPPSGA